MDASFRGLWQALVASDPVKFSESRWVVSYSEGRFAVRVRSRLLRQQIRRHSAGIDVVLLIGGRYEPFAFPYAVFIDTTAAFAASGWPSSAPNRAEPAWSVSADKALLGAAVQVFTAGPQVAEHLVRDYGIPADHVTPIGHGPDRCLQDTLSQPAHSANEAEHTWEWVADRVVRKLLQAIR